MTQTPVREVQTFQPDFEDAPDNEELLMARIPLLSGSVNKVHYLGWRACGFHVREAAKLSDVTEATVRRWRKEDPDFADWESKKLRELQNSISQDLLRIDFMRNMKMAMSRDSQVLYKAAIDLHALTEREYDYLKKIRGYYTPAGLIELDRAMAPEAEDSSGVTAKLTVTIDAREVQDETGRRAAARQLLNKFRVNVGTQVEITASPSGEIINPPDSKDVDGDIIEGEAREVEVRTPASALQTSDPS